MALKFNPHHENQERARPVIHQMSSPTDLEAENREMLSSRFGHQAIGGLPTSTRRLQRDDGDTSTKAFLAKDKGGSG